SLLASITLTPMMCGALLKPIKPGEVEKKNVFVRTTEWLTQGLLKEYKLIFKTMFRFPKLWTLGVFATFWLGTWSIGSYIGNEFIPTSDEDRLEVRMTLPQGSTIDRTADVSRQVEKMFEGYPEVESTLSVLGENG